MHLPHLLSTLSVGLVALKGAVAVHHSSHEIVRRADGMYEAKELVPREERERREAELQKRQTVGGGGVGVGVAGAEAGIGNITLKIGNIKVTTGELDLEDIHIGDITVLVEAGVGKRDNVPQHPLPEGLPVFAPGQIPDGPVQAVIVAGDETVIYTPPSEAVETPSPAEDDVRHAGGNGPAPTPTAMDVSTGSAIVAVATATPTVHHELWKRQNISVPPVSASVGPIGVAVGNVNVSVGDVNVKLGNLLVKNVTIGNILVSVKINAQAALATIVGEVPGIISNVTDIVGGVGGAGGAGGQSSTSTGAENGRKTLTSHGHAVTQFVKERRHP